MKKLFLLVFLLCSLSPAARAQLGPLHSCGEADASGTVSCNADSYSEGPIEYSTRDDDQSVVVEDVTVTNTGSLQAEVLGETTGSGSASVTLRDATINTSTSRPSVRVISVAEGNAVLEVTGNSRIGNTNADAGGIAVLGAAPRAANRVSGRNFLPGATGDLFLTLTEGSTVTARIMEAVSAGDSIAAAVLGEHRHIGALTIRSAGIVESAPMISTSTGPRPGTGYGVAGIMYAGDNRALLDVEINGGMVTSPRAGLLAEHRGTGDVRAVLSAGTITTSATGLLGSGILGRSLNTDQTVSRKVTVLSGGNVITTGAHSFGVYGGHQGLGDLDVSLVGGSVTTAGAGVAALHEGAGNAAVTASAGGISTMGGAGIHGEHRGTGAVTINSAIDIITNGDTARGVWGLITNTGNSGTLDIDITGGMVETGGNAAFAIHGEHRGTGAVTINSAANIITSGDDARGVWGLITNTGNSEVLDIDITGGMVETSGESAQAIYGEHRGTGAVTINSAAGSRVETSGDTAHAIFGVHQGMGAVTINPAAGSRVETSGDTAHAIFGVHQGMGAVTINPAADIITRGLGSLGVQGLIINTGNSGTLTIDITSNRVVTSDDTAHAIYGEHRGLGAVTINSAADIITGGLGSLGVQGLITNADNSEALNIDITSDRVVTNDDTAHAILGEHRGLGAVTINSAADIITGGDDVRGVWGLITSTGNSAALTIDITGGMVETNGVLASAILGEHRGLGAVTINSAAAVITSGQGSRGVWGLITNTGNSAALTIDITGGRVETSGEAVEVMVSPTRSDVTAPYAIYAEHLGMGAVTINSAAAVSTSGGAARGVWGRIRNTGNSEALTIDITGGMVETRGAGAQAIYGEHEGLGAVTINSAAAVSTSGLGLDGLGSIGVQGLIDNAGNSEALTIDITGGMVETSGFLASAILGEHRGLGAVTINSAAAVSTGGSGSIGVQGFINSGYNIFDDDGELIRVDPNDPDSDPVIIETENREALTIDITGGSVETSGAAAQAIHGEHRSLGAVTINSAAEASTSGQGSIGVQGLIDNAENSEALTIDITGGMVETSGEAAHAIYGAHRGLGAVTINSAAEVSARGQDSLGVWGLIDSGYTLIDPNGNVVTDPDDNPIIIDTGNSEALTIDVTGGMVETSGDTTLGGMAHAIHGEHRALGAVTIRSAAEVSTSGQGSFGVQGLIIDTGNSEALNIDVTGGRVETSGEAARAIFGEHRGLGAVTINSAAEVSTSGDSALGVSGFIDLAYNIFDDDGNVVTDDDGNVVIGAGNSEALTIDITGGRVETSGDLASAIYGEHRGLGAVTINSAAEISTSGDSALGVSGFINSGYTIFDDDGELIRVDPNDPDSDPLIIDTGNSEALTIDITGGRVETRDAAASAIHGEHRGLGAVTIRSAADIITRGQGSFGVLGFIANTDNSDGGGLNIDVTGGRVETRGDETYAIYGAHLGRGFELDLEPAPPPLGQPVPPPVPSEATNVGGVTIRSAAEVVTSGRGAHGIVGFLGSEDNVGALNIQLGLGGSVDARGDAAHAIYGEHHGATVDRPAGLRTATTTVTIDGEATGGTGTGRGVFLADGGTVIVGPEGRLSARSGIAVQAATGSLRVSIDGSGFQGLRIGSNVEDIQRIQGSPEVFRAAGRMPIQTLPGDPNPDPPRLEEGVTTIELGGVVLLQGDEELGESRLTGELVHLMYGVTDRSVQLVAEAQAPDPMDCGANCWRWLFSDPIPTSRAFALEVLPQALMNLTRPARDWRSGAYEEAETGPWFTISGHRGSYEPDSASTHSSYDQQWVRAELGIQRILPRWTREGSKTLAGISAHYLDSSTEDIQGAGERRSPIDPDDAGLDTTGAGFGLHLHWQDAHGYYVRAEGGGTWYDGQLAATRMRSDYEGFGWSLSFAGGRSLPWARYPGVMVVPHAQLSLAEVQVDRLTAPFAASVDESGSLRGRLGMRVEKTGQWGEAEILLYGAGSVEYEFDGETAVNTGGEEELRLAVQPEPLLFALSLGAGLSGQGAWLGIKGYELSFQAGSALSGLSNYEASVSADMTLRF